MATEASRAGAALGFHEGKFQMNRLQVSEGAVMCNGMQDGSRSNQREMRLHIRRCMRPMNGQRESPPAAPMPDGRECCARDYDQVCRRNGE